MSTLYPESYQIEVMKYCSKPSDAMVEQAFNSGQWIGQEKKDGALYQLEKTKSGYVYMFSRSKSRKTGELTEKSDNFPHIKQWAIDNLPNETILIGEVYVIGGHSNDVTKLSGCLPKNAIDRQFKTDVYGGPIHYYIFDCIMYAGKNIQEQPTINRLKYLDNYLRPLVKDQKYVEVATTYTQNFEVELNSIFNQGGEGMVFKRKDCPYRAGKRSTTSQMFKYKEHIDSLDLVCIGLEEPVREYTGKEIETWPYWIERGEQDSNGVYQWFHREKNCYNDYKNNPHIFMPVTKHWWMGWKNAMSLGLYLPDGNLIYVGRVASGFTDEIRQQMAEDPQNFIGHVVQVSCMSINKKDHTIRHCVFEQMRNDKDPQDCLFEEVFK